MCRGLLTKCAAARLVSVPGLDIKCAVVRPINAAWLGTLWCERPFVTCMSPKKHSVATHMLVQPIFNMRGWRVQNEHFSNYAKVHFIYSFEPNEVSRIFAIFAGTRAKLNMLSGCYIICGFLKTISTSLHKK